MTINHVSFPAAALVLVLSLTLGGCIPEESPIAPYDRGPVRTQTFALGSDYATQLFFDLDAGTVVQSNPITGYDLGFRSDPKENQVLLNSATISAAADFGPIAFDSPVTAAKANWQSDRQYSGWDSTAIGAWWEKKGEVTASRNHLYLIDRGYDAAAKSRGHVKLMLLGADSASYRIRFANFDGSNDHTVTVARDPLRTVTGFSFDNGGTPYACEPPKGTWDIVMTRYTHIFYNPGYTPYSVTGVLLNRALTDAAADSTKDFASITRADTANFAFSSAPDAIGYAWKSYDISAGKYTVDPRHVYMIRCRDGFVFKLRFVEFYNDKGEKGFPKMEWQKL